MTKVFYTERDIVDLAKQGITTIEINDDVVLTDLGREMAQKHHIRLVKSTLVHPDDEDEATLINQVKNAVIARLGGQVDMHLLDGVVTRVIKGMK
jgi:hypothetical protein